MIAYVPLLVALAGLLMFVLSSNPKLVRIGEILFAAGILVFLFALSGRTVKLLA